MQKNDTFCEIVSEFKLYERKVFPNCKGVSANNFEEYLCGGVVNGGEADLSGVIDGGGQGAMKPWGPFF